MSRATKKSKSTTGRRRAVTPRLPVNPRVFAMLMALQPGPLHGYAIKQCVEEQSSGALRLDPGALYRHLSKLLDDGLVREVAAPDDADRDDERRRYYCLTAFGRTTLEAEAKRLGELLAAARRSMPKRSRA